MRARRRRTWIRKLRYTAVEQLAKRDGAGLFATIEQMVESGHDPRRFVEDFLQRLRDLLIIAVAGEQAKDILGQLPAEQRERMFAQAKQWLSLIHISEPTRRTERSRMPSSA